MTLLALAESWESFWRDDGVSAYGINPLSAGMVWHLYHDHIYRPNGVEIGSPCFVEVAGLDSHVYASDIQYSTALNQHVISINFDTPPTQPQMQYPFEADKRWLLFLGSFLRLHSSRTLPY